MNVIVLTSKQIRRMLGTGLVLTLLAFTLPQIPAWYRAWHGAPAGVTLEGRPVGGRLPGELRDIISRLAAEVAHPARNAGYFQETGQLIPEINGVGVDVEGTLRRIEAAKPGTQLKLITFKVYARRDSSFYKPVYQGRTEGNEVCLAINVAWGEEVIPQLLAILKEENVKATFFFVGDWVGKFPDLVRDIARDGHEIANHGYYHGHPTQMSRTGLEQLIMENQSLLRKTIGRQPAMLFAPPYGEFDQNVLNAAGDLGFRTILWTVDTIDWKRPAPEIIRDRVARKVQPGAIVLMHPTAPTVASLKLIIQDLKSKGLKPVTISRLLQSRRESAMAREE